MAKLGIFDPRDLKTALQFALKARDPDNPERPMLACVHFDFSTEGTCTLVGADGYRLHYTTIRYHGRIPDMRITLNGDDLATFTKAIRVSGASVELWTMPTHEISLRQVYKGTDRAYPIGVYEGAYPDYQRVIPPSKRPHDHVVLNHECVNMLAKVFQDRGVRLEIQARGTYTAHIQAHSQTFAKEPNNRYATDYAEGRELWRLQQAYHVTLNCDAGSPVNGDFAFQLNTAYLVDALDRDNYPINVYVSTEQPNTDPILITHDTGDPNITRAAVIMPIAR